MANIELSSYVTGLSSATLDGSEEVYLVGNEKTTTQDIADLNGAFATTVISIGDWDMDTAGVASVAHGLTFTDIRSISVLIINDTSTFIYPLNSNNAAGVGNGYFYFDNTNVFLIRIAGGTFDSTDYNATSFNRGYITITYAL